MFLQTSPGSWPKDALPKAQGAWSLGGSITGFLISPGQPSLDIAWPAHRRSSQGHHHGYYNYIVDEIPKFPVIYLPTLPSSFPLFVPRISTELTGNSMKVVRSPPGLGLKVPAQMTGGRDRDHTAMWPWARSCHFGGLQVFIWRGGIEWDPPRGLLPDFRVCASQEIREAGRWAQAPGH